MSNEVGAPGIGGGVDGRRDRGRGRGDLRPRGPRACAGRARRRRSASAPEAAGPDAGTARPAGDGGVGSCASPAEADAPGPLGQQRRGTWMPTTAWSPAETRHEEPPCLRVAERGQEPDADERRRWRHRGGRGAPGEEPDRRRRRPARRAATATLSASLSFVPNRATTKSLEPGGARVDDGGADGDHAARAPPATSAASSSPTASASAAATTPPKAARPRGASRPGAGEAGRRRRRRRRRDGARRSWLTGPVVATSRG